MSENSAQIVQLKARLDSLALELGRAGREADGLRTENQRLGTELQHSRDQFQAVLDAVPGGVSWVNADLEYLGINSRLASTFGLSPTDFVGKKIGFLHASPDFTQFVEDFVRGPDQSSASELDMMINDQRRVYLMMAQKYLLGSSAVFVGIDITDRKIAEEKLFRDAFFDKLTGLPNRSLLLERMERCLEYAKRRDNYLFAVMFLDFDGFKHINDSLGHTNGDRLLQLVARRLETLVRAVDTVARLGGDEYVLLLDDISGLHDATHVAERIQRAMTVPYHLEGHEIFLTVSIGITLSAPSYTTTEELLRDSDTAMYRAKLQGRNRYEVFDRKMHAQALQRLELESDLHRSLGTDDFLLHYQPIINLATKKIESVEALVRWIRPSRGFTGPSDFIFLAEETGLIVRLDRWVLRAACRQIRSWIDEFGADSPQVINVNLSSRQFAQPDLVDCISRILADEGLEPWHLHLEITESAIMENMDMVLPLVKGLRDLGIEICIDDFGTGYSSLSYLHRLPLNTLKVDRSFIMEMSEDRQENLEIVRAIVMLAHSLKMKVVAEGIETPQQLDLAKNLGCEYAQGHLFSVALPGAEMERVLRGEVRVCGG